MEKQQAADEIKRKRTNYSINDIQNIILLISTTFLYYQSNIDQYKILLNGLYNIPKNTQKCIEEMEEGRDFCILTKYYNLKLVRYC